MAEVGGAREGFPAGFLVENVFGLRGVFVSGVGGGRGGWLRAVLMCSSLELLGLGLPASWVKWKMRLCVVRVRLSV